MCAPIISLKRADSKLSARRIRFDDRGWIWRAGFHEGA